MNIFKYCCLNEDCDNHAFQYIKKDELEINQPENCISCLSPMKLMGEVIYGSFGGKFSSATPAERKKMLIKRSSDHFNTSGLAERKHTLEKIMKSDIKNRFA